MDEDTPGFLTIPLLIVVVPLRLLWEVLSAIGRFAQACALGVLRPLGRLLYNGVVRPLMWLLRVLVWSPVQWLLRVLALAARWMSQTILVPLGRMILRYVLGPVGIALAWVLAIISTPLVYAADWLGRGLAALWRVVVRPLLAVFGRALVRAWWLAGLVLFHVLVRPARLLWRVLIRPVLRAVARAWRASVVPAARWAHAHAWEPVRAAARSVSRTLGLDERRP